MWQFGVTCLLTAVGLWNVRRCQKNPCACQDLFMLKSGWTRSIFAIQYLGRPEEARRAILDDQGLRRKVINEIYVWIALLLLIGFAQLL